MKQLIFIEHISSIKYLQSLLNQNQCIIYYLFLFIIVNKLDHYFIDKLDHEFMELVCYKLDKKVESSKLTRYYTVNLSYLYVLITFWWVKPYYIIIYKYITRCFHLICHEVYTHKIIIYVLINYYMCFHLS